MKKLAYHICLLLGVSVATIAVDVLPRYQQGNLILDNQVLAQGQGQGQVPSDDELRRYAQAAREIERLRQDTYTEIQGMLPENTNNPPLACNRRRSLNQLPDNARSLAVGYCSQSETIVKRNGLTIGRFNRITNQVKQDPELSQRLKILMSQPL